VGEAIGRIKWGGRKIFLPPHLIYNPGIFISPENR
jgi:hypothetical protein